jgi:hypothetical protein
MAKPGILEPKSIEELTQLFADAGDDPIDGTYGGVAFEVRQATQVQLGLALLAGPLGIDGPETGGPRGLAVRIPLPRQVIADLSLSVGKILDRKTGQPEVAWDLQAADPDAARAYLAEGLEPVLRRLGGRYAIRMDDRVLAFGPLLGTPAESARDLADLVAALPRPTGDEAVVPDFDEAVVTDGGVVEAGVYDGEIDAELARAALESEGIPARAVGGGSAGLWGGTAGVVEVRVLVPRSYAEQAEKVLVELDAADDRSSLSDPPPEPKEE